MEPSPRLLGTDLVEFVHGPVSIYLATRDEKLRPFGSRVWAVRNLEEDRLSIFGQRAALEAHLPRLEHNGEMALSLARPSDDVAYQLKGRYLGKRVGRKEDRAFVTQQVDKLLENLVLIGIPRSTFASWRLWPVLELSMEVREVYNQTPGPRAGEAVS